MVRYELKPILNLNCPIHLPGAMPISEHLYLVVELQCSCYACGCLDMSVLTVYHLDEMNLYHSHTSGLCSNTSSNHLVNATSYLYHLCMWPFVYHYHSLKNSLFHTPAKLN